MSEIFNKSSQPTLQPKSVLLLFPSNRYSPILQFNTIWAEHEETTRPYTLISDDLSQSLITLQNDLEESNLYDDLTLRASVMEKAIPKSLLEQVGISILMKRLPEIYSRSIFSSYVASVSFASALL